MRQALFNSLQHYVGDAEVLDLFAGSGALGFEALSRGAKRAVFVEESRGAIKLIEKNAKELRVLDRVEIIADSVASAWKRVLGVGPYDLVFADPPYAAGWEERLLNEAPWKDLLRADGHFLLEWGVQKSIVKELPEQVPFLVKVREKIYGDSVLSTYQKTEPSDDPKACDETSE